VGCKQLEDRSQGYTPDFVVTKTLRNTTNALLGQPLEQPTVGYTDFNPL